jgi:hypothetical protein
MPALRPLSSVFFKNNNYDKFTLNKKKKTDFESLFWKISLMHTDSVLPSGRNFGSSTQKRLYENLCGRQELPTHGKGIHRRNVYSDGKQQFMDNETAGVIDILPGIANSWMLVHTGMQ